MVNIQSVTEPIKTFTSKGYRLASKHTGIKIDRQLRHVLKELPKDVVAIDFVKVETDFGKGHQNILSIRDKAGKLVKRIISRYKSDKLIDKTISLYEYNANNYRRISRNTYIKDKNVSEIREQFSLNKEANNLLGHTKLTIKKSSHGARTEHQVFESFTKKSKDRKFIETNAQRNAQGHMVKKSIGGNIENIEELKNDPYLYIRNYNDKDFLNAASCYAKKVQGVEDRKINIIDKKLKSSTLGYSGSLPWEKDIVIDIEKHISREELIDTINHELRHQYQDKLKEKQGIINFTLNRNSPNLTVEENKQARRFRKADIFYCPPSISYKKYYNNELEKDARNADEKAVKAYNNSSKLLSNYFPDTDTGIFDYKQGPLENLTNILNKKLIELLKKAPTVQISEPIFINH